ncbi:hypothetical protein [Bradyrhizobium manausense]|uniref:hypothetical protein n=1 Tax=Bradyrhizobium manausense TaxID=989370 RepID=UPI000B284E51|nr:hypothetical protein [Bradyrhizobium manausense]
MISLVKRPSASFTLSSDHVANHGGVAINIAGIDGTLGFFEAIELLEAIACPSVLQAWANPKFAGLTGAHRPFAAFAHSRNIGSLFRGTKAPVLRSLSHVAAAEFVPAIIDIAGDFPRILFF